MGSVDEIDPWGINAPNRAEWLGGREGDVLDNNGRALGSVHLPPGFRPNNIVGRLIVRVQKDELEVERVAVLEIR